MRIDEALVRATTLLGATPDARKQATLLMAHHLQKERTWLVAHGDVVLENEEAFWVLVERRASLEPLEYILGKASFYSREFHVRPGVLIPRPETELLVDVAVRVAKTIRSPRIVEVGTGSGIVAIMLALLVPEANIVATDISPTALDNARFNALSFGVEHRIEFVHTAYMDGLSGAVDLLVSNPPYIAKRASLEPHVLQEPHEALFGGERGDEVLHVLLENAHTHGVRHIVCEMGHDQKKSMQHALQALGAKDIVFYKDLAGFDRGFSATLKE